MPQASPDISGIGNRSSPCELHLLRAVSSEATRPLTNPAAQLEHCQLTELNSSRECPGRGSSTRAHAQAFAPSVIAGPARPSGRRTPRMTRCSRACLFCSASSSLFCSLRASFIFVAMDVDEDEDEEEDEEEEEEEDFFFFFFFLDFAFFFSFFLTFLLLSFFPFSFAFSFSFFLFFFFFNSSSTSLAAIASRSSPSAASGVRCGMAAAGSSA